MSQAVSGSTCMGALWSVYWKLSSVADPHSHLESSRRLAKLLGYKLSDIPELMRGLRDLDNMNPDMRPKICRNGLMVLVSGIEDFIDDFLDDQQTDGSEVDDMYMTVGDKLRYLIHSCDELKRIFVKKGRLGTSAEYRPDVLPPSSLDATAGLVGIVSSREKLVNWLMEKEEQPKGVTIVGAPGSGKTTLATDVFRQIEGHFQYGVTVSVSPQPEMNKLFEHVLSQMDPNLCRPSEKLERDWQETYMEKQERLMSSIIQFLQNKRCLFLIDDVWDGTSWDIIQSVLLKGCSGNRIIVTTQNVMIEDSCSKHCSWLWHTVMPLSEQQSWMLFSRNVFASQDGKCPDHLRKACKEIMKKCEGLPSAITAISYLMKEHWKVQSSTIPRTEMIPELRTLSKRLFSSSYMHLTQPLRTLLLYMSMFIYECKIEKGPLICKWIAEGFYSPQTYTRMERLAELDYFHLIAWNVIIAPMPTGRPTKPAFGLCRVHFLVHQAIESTSAEECFLFTSNTLKSIDSDKARRISLQYYDPDLPSLLERLDLKFTYSLTLFDEVNRVPLEKFTMLRVLDMQGWKNVEEDDLSVICNMHLLKYLSLRNTRVSLIPSLIKQLHFLQTLDIRQTHISELPPEVCELRHLRNAYFGETYISELPPQIEKLRELERLEIAQTKISKLPSEFSGLLYLKELNLSQTKITNLPPQFKALNQLKSLDLSHTNISKLPSEVCKLKHLETLDLRGTKVVHLSKQVIQLRQLEHLFVGSDDYSVNARVTLPDGIRHLRFLKTLVTVDLSRCSTSVVHELSEIRELKELAMVWSSDEQSLDRKYVECLLSSLRSLHCLTCLTILGHYGCSMEFLHSLKNPPSLLQSLKITGTLSKVPDWITQLKDLCYIQVKVCKFGDDELIVLGQLQNLQYLKLGLEFLPEKEMVIRTEGFPSLERFSVDCRVLWLLFDKGAMPLLATLELKFCSGQVNHNAIPIVGIQHLQRLNHVILRYSTLYDNVPGVKATVDTMKNAIRSHLYPIKLVINGIEDDLEANVLRQHACTTQIKCDGDSKIESEIKEQREDA